ncbi:MAG: DUF5119 domain-containing protein [Rikenellaceae bacterium]
MKKLVTSTITLLSLWALFSCTRRQQYDGEYSCESVEIEVIVDWSNSGITPSDTLDSDYVHMVSVRFFPLDGSKAFDRYLQSNIYHGVIDVPVGEYSVVVYNESIDDPYWSDTFTFEDTNDYDLFAAKIVEHDESLYSFYEKQEEEKLSNEALKLASWSMDYFCVSSAMATGMGMNKQDQNMMEALKEVALRKLTTYTTITVEVENLASASTIHASLKGLSEVVYLATGETSSSPVTHIIPLSDITWYGTDSQHGEISEQRLTFTTLNVESDYSLELDILFVDGSRYDPEEVLIYDITDQITGVSKYADDELSATVAVSLPEINSGIDVEQWGDEQEIIIK